ncbi:MAG: hypothetical protein ABI615_11275 [Chthoniobacterales bacterium]
MRLALYKGTSLLSRAIQWQTRSEYSHAAFLLSDGSVIEAWQCGGVLHNAHIGTAHEDGTPVDVFTIKGLTRSMEHDLIGLLTEELGKRYDFAGILGFIDRVKQPVDDKWFCSELVFAKLEEVGIRLLSRIVAAEVNPGHLRLPTCFMFDETLICGEPKPTDDLHRFTALEAQ